MTTLQLATASGIPGLVVKGTVLLLLGWFGALLLRRAPAGARHGLWLTAIVGVMLVPLIAPVANVRLAVLPAPHAPHDAASPADPLANVGPTASAPVGEPIPQSVPPSGTRATSSTSLVSIAIGLWLCVAAVVVAWLIGGAARVRHLLRRARVLDTTEWTRSLQDVSDMLKIGRRPRLVMSDEIETAFACGVVQPTIMLPRSAEEWSDDRRRAVLLHEAAHIQRRDLVGHIIAGFGCALYWFHPLMWMAAHHLRAESELACDDMVLDAGVRPSEYAQHLLDLVTGLDGRAAAPAVALPMVRSRAFEGRMQAILERANRWKLGQSERGLVIGLFALLTASIAAVAPVPRSPASPPQPQRTALVQAIGDTLSQGQLTAQPVRRATLSQVFVRGAAPANRFQRDSVTRRERVSDSASARRGGVPTPVLASTPCQRAVGAQAVPTIVDTAYARLFDGIRMTTDQENRACEVLLRLHFEQVAADSITELALEAGRVKLITLQAQRNALLRGVLTNEADRATLDARAQEVGVGAGALRTPSMDWSGVQRGGGGAGGGMRGRVGGGAAPVLDSVIIRGGGRGGMRARGGGGGAPVLDSAIILGGGGGRGARGRGGDPAAAANLGVAIVNISTRITFQRLFQDIALTADQEARALEIIRAAEEEARTVAPPPRMVRLRIAPVPGVVTLHDAGMAELMAILSSDTERATLQSRIIVVPR